MNVHNYNETDVLHNYLLKARNKSSENKHLILNHSIKTWRLSNLVVRGLYMVYIEVTFRNSTSFY